MEVQYPLVIFTLALCIASGMLAIQGWLLFKNRGSRAFHLTAVIVEVVVLVIGGFASFLHLQHWERIFNGFGNPTSGITQELVGVVVFIVIAVLLFVTLRKGTEGEESTRLAAPWLGIVALVFGIIMGFVTAHSYYMESRPAWANPTLYLYYYSNELLLGAGAMWLLAAVKREDAALAGSLAKLTLVGAVIALVATVVAGVYYSTIELGTVGIAFHTTDPTAPAANPSATLSSPISGEAAPLFWVGAVVVGTVLPGCAALLGLKSKTSALPASVVGLLCAIVGSFCFRLVLYVVGVSFYVYF